MEQRSPAQDYQPTAKQLEKREKAEALIAGVEDGTITSVVDVDPREVSTEALHQARAILRQQQVMAGAVIGRVNGKGVITI